MVCEMVCEMESWAWLAADQEAARSAPRMHWSMYPRSFLFAIPEGNGRVRHENLALLAALRIVIGEEGEALATWRKPC